MVQHRAKIEIANITECDDVVVRLSVFFIKGTVSCHCCDKSLFNGTLTVENEIDRSTTDFPVTEGDFKCITRLNLGLNQFKLNYLSENHVSDKSVHVQRKPNSNRRLLKLVYIVPKGDNGRFQSVADVDNSATSACKRIIVGAKLIQTLIAERLYEQGHGRKTFNLFCDDGAEPTCVVHHSRHTKSEFHTLSSEQIWNLTAKV